MKAAVLYLFLFSMYLLGGTQPAHAGLVRSNTANSCVRDAGKIGQPDLTILSTGKTGDRDQFFSFDDDDDEEILVKKSLHLERVIAFFTTNLIAAFGPSFQLQDQRPHSRGSFNCPGQLIKLGVLRI